MTRLLLLLMGLGMGWTLPAQTDSTAMTTNPDSSTLLLDTNRVAYRQITAYLYQAGSREKQYVKRSWLDTNGVVTQQERTHYTPSDTGAVRSKYYTYRYDPRTRRGSYYTEYFPTPKNPTRAYSKQEVTFKNYDNQSDKRVWTKIQQRNSRQLLRQIQQVYDKNGYLTKKTTTDYSTSPSSTSTEEVARNKAGNMVRWTSFDDDGDTKTQARDFTASYLNDTLLLRSNERLYYSANEIINKYDRNNQLKKQVQRVGNLVKDKARWNTQTTTWYKEGRPFKSQEKHLKKTVKKIAYTHTATQTTLAVTSSEGNYTDTKTWTYHDSFPTLPVRYVETQKGKPFVEKTWTYAPNGQLLQHTELEYRSNNKNWREVEHYNDRGQLYWHQFFVGGQPTTEERYQYRYYPPKAFSEE